MQFDVFVPELVYLERLVVGKLLAPLNLDYIPNLEANVWPTLVNPWYDFGSRYTVPYTIYTTGIGWRTDYLPHFNPDKLAKPWSALWTEGPHISGKVGMLDDQHEGLTMGLLHNGVTDVNTSNAKDILAAQKSIQQLIGSANLKFDTNEYEHLADGSLWLHQAWSGDMAVIPEYAPQGRQADGVRLLVAEGRARPDRQRHAGDPPRRQEPGARPPVPQPPDRRGDGVHQLRLYRLPAAAEGNDPRRRSRIASWWRRTCRTR